MSKRVILRALAILAFASAVVVPGTVKPVIADHQSYSTSRCCHRCCEEEAEECCEEAEEAAEECNECESCCH